MFNPTPASHLSPPQPLTTLSFHQYLNLDWLDDDSDDDYYVPPPTTPLPQSALTKQPSVTPTTITTTTPKSTPAPSSSTPRHSSQQQQQQQRPANNDVRGTRQQGRDKTTTTQQPQQQQQQQDPTPAPSNGTPTVHPGRCQPQHGFAGGNQAHPSHRGENGGGRHRGQVPQYALYFIGTQSKPHEVEDLISTTFTKKPNVQLIETPAYPSFINQLKLTRYDFVFLLSFPDFAQLSTFYGEFLSQTVSFRLFFAHQSLESRYTALTTTAKPQQHTSRPSQDAEPPQQSQQQQHHQSVTVPVIDSYISKSEVVQIRSRDDILRERAEKEAAEQLLREQNQQNQRDSKDNRDKTRSDRKKRDTHNKTSVDLAHEKLSQKNPTVLDAEFVASWREGKNTQNAPKPTQNSSETRGNRPSQRGRGGGGRGGARDSGPRHGHQFSSDSEDETTSRSTKPTRPPQKPVSTPSDTTQTDLKDDPSAAKDARGGVASYGRGRGRGVAPGHRRSQSGTNQSSKYNSRRGSQQQDGLIDDLTQKMGEVRLEEGTQKEKGGRRSYKGDDTTTTTTDHPVELKPARSNRRQNQGNQGNQADQSCQSGQGLAAIAHHVVPKGGKNDSRKAHDDKKHHDDKKEMYDAIEKIMANENGDRNVTFDSTSSSKKDKEPKEKKSTSFSKSVSQMSQNSFAALLGDDEQ